MFGCPNIVVVKVIGMHGHCSGSFMNPGQSEILFTTVSSEWSIVTTWFTATKPQAMSFLECDLIRCSYSGR